LKNCDIISGRLPVFQKNPVNSEILLAFFFPRRKKQAALPLTTGDNFDSVPGSVVLRIVELCLRP
jgi:hypothetical protein